MADRISEIVIGLQRMGENARIREEDIRYVRQQEDYEFIGWLDQQLGMLDKVRAELMGIRKRVMPVEQPRVAEQKQDQVPKFIQKGPRTAEG
jgi:hypothetical protein